ncbi:MAG: pyridoxamine 5'-phosphate oxidase family protein [Flavisolibacter sp.]|jgi:nitroimidazol reductase NimA-like FMN-containing flavoprotein (pyridoxamine 5'-phosphate oxidase superfamily)
MQSCSSSFALKITAMLGQLKTEQIEEFLSNHIIGHLGCHADGKSYVVPISYAFDGDHIYCHTHEGKKIEMMRKNPSVCFQVDDLHDLSNWNSVVLWGRFEELHNDKDRNDALQILMNRSLPFNSSSLTQLGANWPFSPADTRDIKGIVFRIRIEEKTGRFESTMQSPALPG